MYSDKALGLNGFPMAFLQACWDVIKVDIMGRGVNEQSRAEPSPSLGCSGSARLLLGQARARARARVEPRLAARARLDKG
jgi:hypothetical protein